jgi:nucleoside-diphosphate-sugar epimerase
MTVLVLGATGMTGRSVVSQLLANGHRVRIIVRSVEIISEEIVNNPNLEILQAAVLDLSDHHLAEQVNDCTAIISCLGHNMDFKGLFSQPRRLCTEAVRRVCVAIEKQAKHRAKFILISSVGVTSSEDTNKRSWFDRALLFVLRHTLPPHRDNETAAQYLHDIIGTNNPTIEWCCVRPDSLINAEISTYQLTHSPVTGIVSGRPTTRKNVGHFMVELVENSNSWKKWKFKMPVIMNIEE